MLTLRHAAMALILAIAAGPAFAETCNLTVTGRTVLDDEPCTVSTRGGAVVVRQGNIAIISIRRSILRTRLLADRISLATGRKRRGLRSFGLVVKSDSQNDKVCYFNQKATLCIEQ